jgi:hypothetical protein
MLAIINSPKNKVIRVIGFITIGYIIYEILQPYLPKGVFDLKDIYGTFIGGIISIIILFIINKSAKNRVIYKL